VKICIPVNQDNGLKSQVWPHFGSAPAFMLMDTASGDYRVIPNQNQHHAHGMCQPLAALAGESVEAIVVGGIGLGALNKLVAANIRVFFAEQETVEETLGKLEQGLLTLMQPNMACQGRGHH
jgi:predicted Fe-Mo cluster-binding NifX family protein